jgi:N-carbamoylputrescine amidase
MTMKVTVCEFEDESEGMTRDWERLVAHVKAEASDVVLLPEMPFHPWIAGMRPFDPVVWQKALLAHDAWHKRFDELAPATILGTRPVNSGSQHLNQGFVWNRENGYRAAHFKHYLPEEEGFWEASWFQRGDGDFSPIDSGTLRIGFLICSELWFLERARTYGKAGVNLIVTPRTTERSSVDKWLAGGQTAAIVSGAFSLSSNRVNQAGKSPEFGGQGWIIGPDGDVLGLTSRRNPFVTVEINLVEAELAKGTYPRYVIE